MSSKAAQPWPAKSEEELRKLPRLPLPGDPIGTIRACIRDHKTPKWGFLIYRCDYSSDEAWKKFISIVQWNMKDALEILKATDLEASLDLTTKEDRERLDGASVDQVRDIFKIWVESAEAKEELRDAPYDGPFCYPRYTHCVHVDADAIESVVNRAPQPPKFDRKKIGYVNLVRLDAKDFTDGGPNEVILDDEEPDDVDEDENLVKVPISSLFGPETYAHLFDNFTFDELRRYRRQDSVSWR